MKEEDRNSFSLKLEDMENWLYEDGEFAERSVYQVRGLGYMSSGIFIFPRNHPLRVKCNTHLLLC